MEQGEGVPPEETGDSGQPFTREAEPAAPTSLKNYLVEAARTESMALERLPESIDLGEFGREAEKLIQLSLADPRHREYGSIAFKAQDGRVLLLNTPVVGTEHHVRFPAVPQGAQLFLHIHSHGDRDIPFSIGDLVRFFRSPDPSDAALISAPRFSGEPGSLLVTPEVKMLVLRTNDTPLYLPREIWWRSIFNTDLWVNYHRTPGPLTSVLQALRSLLPLARPSEKAWYETISYPQMLGLRDIANKYRLKIYSCPLTKNIAHASH